MFGLVLMLQAPCKIAWMYIFPSLGREGVPRLTAS